MGIGAAGTIAAIACHRATAGAEKEERGVRERREREKREREREREREKREREKRRGRKEPHYSVTNLHIIILNWFHHFFFLSFLYL